MANTNLKCMQKEKCLKKLQAAKLYMSIILRVDAIAYNGPMAVGAWVSG